MTAWRAMDEAPRDGTEILIWDGRDRKIVFWAKDKSTRFEGWTTGWETAGGYDVGYASIYEPLVWHPLPERPND